MDVVEITEAPAEKVVEESQESQFATVGEVFDDGVTLIFDGQDEATDKHYKVNTSIVLVSGDRVKVLKDSGTYVVEYVVGSPQLRVIFPSGGTNGQVLTKNGATDYSIKWSTIYGIPSGGTSGQVLSKSSNANYSVEWTDLTTSSNTNQLYYSSTVYCTLNSSRQLVPHSHSSTVTYSLGSSSLPWASLYIGRGAIQLGNNATYNTLGFFGASPVSRQTISSSSTNMNYSSATSSNYLTLLNNLIGILKNKYGLIY